MRVLSVFEGEAGAQILSEVLDLSNTGNEGSIKLGLSVSLGLDIGFLSVTKLGSAGEAYLSFVLEELVVLSSGLLTGFGEEFVSDVVGRDSSQVDLSRGGDHVGLVDSAEGDSVDLVGSGHKEKAAVQLLDEDNSSSSEASGKDDQYGTGGDALSESGRFGNSVGSLEEGLNVVAGVILSLNFSHLY